MRFRTFHLRQIGLSKEAKKRLWLLLAIFAVTFIIFSLIINHNKFYSTKAMSEASLPTITSKAYGTQITELHGYLQEMDACYMRDSVIPISSKRQLPLVINTYGQDITGISYEIRSTDTSRKIAETKVKNFSTAKDGSITLSLKLENLVEEGQEYLFIITLTNDDDQEIYYYTRVLIPSEDCYEKECFNFVKYFHNKSLSDDYSELSTYVETSDDANTDTLSEVTLQSSLAQIGFEGFDASLVSKPVIEIKDICSSYTVVEYTYQLKLKDDKGNTEYYNVNEYYKVRYGIERIYMLDYRRTMEEVLDEDDLDIAEDKLAIGVAESDVDYLSNETGTIVSFVQAGELFEYNQNSRELKKVFSFADGQEKDSRALYSQHNEKLLSIDENGNMDFAVYGYMNRGSHEGYCGIDLYHYDAESGKTIEQAFVATTYSYQILNASFSDLLYKTSANEFYILVNGDLLCINLKNMDTERILEGLSESQYAASKSGRYIAYTDKKNGADYMTVLDLETGKSFKINAPSGSLIRPLEFMNEDLVYGLIKEKDIGLSVSGTKIYPISTLYIREVNEEDGQILKKYSEKGYYISDVVLDSYTLILNRVQKSDQGYVTCDGDTIKNSSGEQNKAVTFVTEEDSVKGENTIIETADLAEDEKLGSISFEEPLMSFIKAKKVITVDTSDCQQQYYVYMGSSVLYASTNVANAIAKADEEMGIVVDSSGHYIWRRGRKSYCNSLKNLEPNELDASSDAISKCVSAILSYEGDSVEVNGYIKSGKSPYKIMTDVMKDKLVLNLTGVPLTEVLYYVSSGYPVYARTGDDSAVIVAGYDAASVTLYSPLSGSYTKMSLLEATNMFEEADNVFITYVDTGLEEDED